MNNVEKTRPGPAGRLTRESWSHPMGHVCTTYQYVTSQYRPTRKITHTLCWCKFESRLSP